MLYAALVSQKVGIGLDSSSRLAVIQTALLDGKRFKGRYQPRDRDLAEYEFNPRGLVFRQRVIYLVATLWDYDDPRQFAVHRFDQATPLDRDVTLLDGFALDTYIDSGAFSYADPDAEPSCLVLRMSAAAAGHLHETPLSDDQVISEDPDEPGWVQVSASQQESEQLYWWLLGFGADAEVLAPEGLRLRMMTTAHEMAARYGLA